jgi:lysophospholipase L1-like esterase
VKRVVLAVGVIAALVGGSVALSQVDAPPSAASGAVSVTPERAELAEVSVPGLKRLVVYGHSMPEGGGASDVSLSYAVLAAEATGSRLVNRAEGGASAAMSSWIMAQSRPAGPHDAVIIHTGMNDIFRRGDDAVTQGRRAVRHLLANSADAGRRVVILECQPASWMDTPPQEHLQPAYKAWNEMLLEEAARWPDVGILDTCESWDPSVYTDVPRYHPNDEGHALIAADLVAMLAGS